MNSLSMKLMKQSWTRTWSAQGSIEHWLKLIINAPRLTDKLLGWLSPLTWVNLLALLWKVANSSLAKSLMLLVGLPLILSRLKFDQFVDFIELLLFSSLPPAWFLFVMVHNYYTIAVVLYHARCLFNSLHSSLILLICIHVDWGDLFHRVYFFNLWWTMSFLEYAILRGLRWLREMLLRFWAKLILLFLRTAKVRHGALKRLLDGRVGSNELLLKLVLRNGRLIAVLSWVDL